MAKRKRDDASKEAQKAGVPTKVVKTAAKVELPPNDGPETTVQIVTGSYERVLHGFTAAIPSNAKELPSSVQFVDTFLFEAHASAIRCLAVSPLSKTETSEPQKVILASGGTDERINLYSLSASPVATNDSYPTVPTLAGNKILENPKNRELGSLLHHSANICALHFPSRSKLLAAAEDNTISVTKTRDWTVVSTIKAPRPKVQGRPSGDTAPPGGSPAGVNDFAVHPSMKLMLTVGRGEKCMRLWNLVTGKKAGVLNFSKEILQSVKEGKWSPGEGRKIEWNSEGDEFAVAFEWGAVIFGTDSIPICRALPSPRSKIHQIKYVDIGQSTENKVGFLAVSTEDGRVIFYSTKKVQKAADDDESPIPYAEAVASLGGKQADLPGRVKDFEILKLDSPSESNKDEFVVVTGGSDGTVRLWLLDGAELHDKKASTKTPQVGKLLNSYETGNRITCLKAFVMLAPEDPSALDFSEDELESDEAEESASEESDDE
ncbi:hypothetical protein ASPZODRAFT_153575 [Penicilliopsis zonata CBS 506.65]|uniref:60S ribosome biogenesis protein Mak11 n=1 Tax=Penicilliopsis zonata CBS 506.65 TaxID=1073090 RepID=A0A1L9SBU0_9EURO|nr:hypothetical protein ASPZODRAFT_153575 [Penicilliopsis zonata CBS 506.65]OJJ44675.1 hypothetical protein ASPZODRAFT_153575 [Penicilliopsis zonata CBS 506.65]